MKKTPLKKKSKNKIPILKRKAWVVFSKWIRARDKNICFTCGAHGGHAGHFIPQGGHQSVMFDEINVHAQCVGCNLWRHGNLHEYSARLIEKYGDAEFKALVERGRKTHKLTEEELLAIIEKYK